MSLAGLLLLTVALAPEPAEVMAAAQGCAAANRHVSLLSAGQSVEGRELPLLIVTGRPNGLADQIRVLVLARQHGDEPAPGLAAMRWMKRGAGSAERYDRVAVLLMPLVNPDGAVRGTRRNAAGVDLNRDWVAQSQPETRAVEAVVARYQPHVIVDLHQFGLHDPVRQPDWIEWFPTGDRGLDDAASELAAELVHRQRLAGASTRLVATPAGYATTLCHRRFAAREKAVALLVEVGATVSAPQAQLIDDVVDRLDARADLLKPRLDELRGVRRWRAPDAPEPPRRWAIADGDPAPVAAPPPLAWTVVGYLLAMLGRAKFRGEQDEI